jgi:hypothetical protein
MSLYQRDWYAWTQTSAELLRQGRWHELDAVHIAEELESMGKSEQRALENRLTALLAHLLKWQYQPGRRGKSWQRTLIEQRKQIHKLLRENPSLQTKLESALEDAYDSAIRWAAEETGLEESVFPQVCAYSLESLLNPEFYPED